jgi:precorrin-2 dehydrogenase/sirohydrochlorin ferrochelatase
MIPIVLNLSGRLCVVVGGGAVGQRKVQAILAAGGRVRLVCREPRDPRLSHPRLEWITADYQPEQLEGANLVFAAATGEVNRQVVVDAHARGLLVNCADEPDEGDFILPAVLRRGELTIAVSTGGASPMLAQVIRDRLEGEFDANFALWTRLLAEFRPQILQRVTDRERRQQLLARLCRLEWLERLRRDGGDAVRAAMQAEVDALVADGAQRL